MMHLLTPPMLTSFEAKEYLNFLSEFETYETRGGKQPFHLCMPADLFTSCYKSFSPSADIMTPAGRQEFRQAVDKFALPKDYSSVMSILKGIRMTGALTLANVMRYSSQFQSMYQRIGPNARISEKAAIRCYFANLHEPEMANTVECEGNLESLADAVAAIIQLAAQLESNKQNVQFYYGHRTADLWTATQQQHRSSPKTSTPKTTKPDTKGKPPFPCRYCKGDHWNRDCPKKDTMRPTDVKKPTSSSSANKTPYVKKESNQPSKAHAFTLADQHADRPDNAHVNHFSLDTPTPQTELKAPDNRKTPDVLIVSGHVTTANISYKTTTDQCVPVSALLDSGADTNLISSRTAQKLNAKISPSDREVETVNGSRTPLQGITELTFIFNSPKTTRCRLQCYVMDCDIADLIIGYPSLRDTGLLVSATLMTLEAEPKSTDEADDFTEFDDENLESVLIPDYSNVIIDDPAFRKQFDSIVDSFDDLFQPGPHPERAKLPPFELRISPDKQMPKPARPHRLSPDQLAAWKEEYGLLLQHGQVRASSSPYASPSFMVPKPRKNPTDPPRWRVVNDFRLVNDVTEQVDYPLPHPQTMLDNLSGKKVFTLIDQSNAYHQCRVAESTSPLLAIVVEGHKYEWLVMPQGLKQAPGWYQKHITEAFADLIDGGICQFYLDDCIIAAADRETCLQHTTTVLQRFRDLNLRLTRSKCFFGLSQVEYLGHIINERGVTMSTRRRQAIADMEQPHDLSSLRSFLGMAQYFHRYIQNFSTLARPLTRLLSTKVRFEWNDERRLAFHRLKNALVHCPILALVDYSRPILLQTDASTAGIGAALYQVVDNDLAPVAFASKTFTPTQTKWSTIEQEGYALVYAVHQFKHYLRGRKFIVQTDHKNLVFINASQTPKIVRWRLLLNEFDYVIEHIPGSRNVVADALSRCLFARLSPLLSEEGWTHGQDANAVANVPNVPNDHEFPHREIIQRFHNHVVGHRGIAATIKILKDAGHTWAGIDGEVRRYIDACSLCQKIRGHGTVIAALKTTAVDEPFAVWGVDTIGPLPPDSAGRKYILVVMDEFTRFVELQATDSTTAIEFADFFVTLLGRYGPPRAIRSDRGTQFVNGLIDEFVKLLKVDHQLTLPYRPEANGTVERANQEIMRFLQAIVINNRQQQSWSRCLPFVQRIVNATVSTATGFEPVRLLFGGAITPNRLILPEVLPKTSLDKSVTFSDYFADLHATQLRLLQSAQKHQEKVVQDRLKKSPENPTEFKQGDLVLLSYPNGNVPNKLHAKWRGPYTVVKRRGNTYTLQELNSRECSDFDISRLRAYVDDPNITANDVAALDDNEYFVEAITDHRNYNPKRKNDVEFRVLWQGYSPDEATWEPYRNVKNTDALSVYLEKHPELRL